MSSHQKTIELLLNVRPVLIPGQASAGVDWMKSPFPKLEARYPATTHCPSLIYALTMQDLVCEAENVFGVTRAYATLAVQGIPDHTIFADRLLLLTDFELVPVSFIKMSPEIVNVSLGQNVTLDCMTAGYPTPTVTWSRVDELPESSRVEGNGSLIVENVTQSDLGQYVCTAHNDLGTTSYSVTLELGITCHMNSDIWCLKDTTEMCLHV